jgi:HK97 family phage prohead protease
MIKFTAVPVTLDAAAGEDAPRTITGIAVPWDTVATVSGGEKVMFKRGAFDLNAKPARLLENHDGRPIGIVNELVDLDNGLGFSATFARSKAADDVVELIQMSAYDSVSVGAVPKKFKYDKNGVMIVSSADLQELSVVSVPAFADAIIEQIAASEHDPEVVEEEDEPQPDTSLQEETMSTETQVEASAPDVIPTSPIFASARREAKLPTAVEYIAAAVAGGSAWHQMSEALRAAAPDIVTTDTPGILPTPIVSPVYNNFIGRRPVVDAIGVKAMPQSGKVFIRPEVTTHVSIGASIAEQSPTAGTMVVFNNQVTKQIFGGYVNISEADIDWSDPAILSVVLDDMGRIYANATDNYAADQLVAGTTQTEAFALADIAKPEVWAAEIAKAASTILTASNGNLPTHLFVAPDRWQDLLGLSDSSKRPLFPQVGPMNAFGNLAPGQYNGNAFGLQVVVDRNFASGVAIVADASGYELFEQQKGAMSIESPSTLSRTLAFRGYFAALMIDSSKFVQFAFA